MMGSRPSDFSNVRRSQPPPRKTASSRPPRSLPQSRPAAVSRRDVSVQMTVEQLLREPSGPRSEPPRSLSNAALMASLRPPPDYANTHALRRSMEPHLVEGLSWFLERAPWQRALLSTGLGAAIGVGIVVTLARLFVPELGSIASAAPASQLTALAAPAAATLLPPPPAAPEPAAPAAPPEPSPALADPQGDGVLPAATAAGSAQTAPEAAPVKTRTKAARKGKAAKRSKKARQRARKPRSLPARWSELYARER